MDPTAAKEIVSVLFDDWYAPLLRYSCRARGSMDLAEEVVQEAFLALFRELVAGAEIRNPRGWTLCVVRRELSRRHKAKVLLSRKTVGLSDVPEIADRHEATEDWREMEIGPLLSVLTAREKEVILLRTKTLKYREIGKELGISANSVRTLLARGLRKMQQAVRGRKPDRFYRPGTDDEDTDRATLQ